MSFALTYDDGMTEDIDTDMKDYVDFLDKYYNIGGKFEDVKNFIEDYNLEELIDGDDSFMEFLQERYPEDDEDREAAEREDVDKGDRDLDLQQEMEDSD